MVRRYASPYAGLYLQCGETSDGANSGRQSHGLFSLKSQVAAADLHALRPADLRRAWFPKPKPFWHFLPAGRGNESAEIQEGRLNIAMFFFVQPIIIPAFISYTNVHSHD